MSILKRILNKKEDKRNTLGQHAHNQLPQPVELYTDPVTHSTYAVELDEQYRPYLSITTQHRGNIISSSAVYLNKPALQKLAEMFAQAAEIEYPDVYHHCAAPLPEGDAVVAGIDSSVLRQGAGRLVFENPNGDASNGTPA